MKSRTEAAIALIIVGLACIAGLWSTLKPAEAGTCIKTDLSDLPPEAITVQPPDRSGVNWI